MGRAKGVGGALATLAGIDLNAWATFNEVNLFPQLQGTGAGDGIPYLRAPSGDNWEVFSPTAAGQGAEAIAGVS